MEPFKIDQESGFFWIQSWRERYPDLNIGFTSRSLGPNHPYGNLALHVGDDPDRVHQNRLYLSELNDVSIHTMTCALQPHGNHVVEVTGENRGAGAFELESSIPDADGLLTRLPNTMLTLFFADCVPLFFLDPVKKVVGLAHAGWRGTVQNIAAKMVQKFQETHDSKSDNIHIVIGPSIGPCCYQVDQTVMNAVNEQLAGEVNRVAKADGPGHFRLDLKKMNQILLERAGILSSHIEVSQLCTSCNVDQFFSHRKEQGKAGRMAAFAVWKGEGI